MYILGISCFYHESAACLIKDGEIIAASAEERFSRIKHDSSFPAQAINFCLKQAGASVGQLDYVVFYEKPFIKFQRNLLISLRYYPKTLPFFIESIKNSLSQKLWVKSIITKQLKVSPEKILFVPHHISHASAAYFNSLFESAAYLTLDGVGEWHCGSWGKAKGNQLFPKASLNYPHSVGLLYSSFTAFLGFEVNEGEYKVMGLAAYGKPKYLDKVSQVYKQFKDGSIELDLSYFDFYKASRMYSQKFKKEFSGLDKNDLAASIQVTTEEIILNMCRFIRQQTKEDNLVFGGGVALNSVVNSKILSQTGFKKLFIFPASGDDGGAVGAALYTYFVLGGSKRRVFENPFLGQSFSNQEIEKFLRKKKIKYKKLTNFDLVSQVTTDLKNGKVVGWFEGRAEFGPRALGHRSILADPRTSEMKDLVNRKVKFREDFRPFAPAILVEQANNYFYKLDPSLSQFMLGTFRAKPIAKKQAPAIVHIDGSARVQIVEKDFPGNFRKLLESFFAQTGVPILLNTSFNLKGEPIVNSLEDAYSTFRRSGIDTLVLENYLVRH